MPTPSACLHTQPPRLPYGASQTDAERRLKAKQHQWYCRVCGRWIWGEFWLVDPESTGVLCDTDPIIKALDPTTLTLVEAREKYVTEEEPK